MNLDNPLGHGSGRSTPRGPGYQDPSTLNEDERRIATELSTALATTTYEIRDKLSEVMPGLFLSNGQIAQDLALLRAQRISHILNMAPIEVPTTAEFYAEEKIDFKAIVAKDEFDYDVMQHWPEARAYLDAALNEQNGRVLVHCQAGINRSGAIAVAYMMVTRRRLLVDAAKSAKRKRYQLITNLNFQLALVKFASAEGLLGKPALPRRMSSPNPYPGSPVATDEFGSTRWPFGCKGKPAVLFLHGTFAPVHQGHMAALQSSLAHIRTQLPELQLAGAFFSPCHQVEALSHLTPDKAISLEDRLAMLKLACPGATTLAEIPVAVDTWECSQMAPPSLSTSVRSFARRATAAAIRRGLDALPVVVWVVGTSGLHWDAAVDGMDVDPSLVSVCVVVDKGQEEEEKLLSESLKDGPLQDRVRWVHAKGPNYSSEKVREGTLPAGLPAIETYAREHLLWHSPSAHELYLARLVHQGLVREGVEGWGEEEVLSGLTGTEEEGEGEEETKVEMVGNLWAQSLRRPNVWRCYYKPPPPPPYTPAESPKASKNGSARFFQEFEEGHEHISPHSHKQQQHLQPPLPPPVPILPPRQSTTSVSAFSSASSIVARLATQNPTPIRRLVIKLFPPSQLEAQRVEEEAYRRLEFVRLQHEGALALPPLVGMAKDSHHRQAALIFEDAIAQGWEMVDDSSAAATAAAAAAAAADGSGGLPPSRSNSSPRLSSLAGLAGPATPLSIVTSSSSSSFHPVSPLSSGASTAGSAANASADEKVLKAVKALAWLHVKNWGIVQAAQEDGPLDPHFLASDVVLNGSSSSNSISSSGSSSSLNGRSGGGGAGAGGEIDGFPLMWRRDQARARSQRLSAALASVNRRGGNLVMGLFESSLAALEGLAQDVGLLGALYRPCLSLEEVQRWGLPEWLAEGGGEGGREDDEDARASRVASLTIIHGGLTWDKLGFSQHASDGVLAVGWERACIGSGAWDLALLLATARRGYEEEKEEEEGEGDGHANGGNTAAAESSKQQVAEMAALRLYHQVLRNGGVEDYNFDRLLSEYRRARAGLAPELLAVLVRLAEDGEGENKDEKERSVHQAAVKAALEASLDLLKVQG